MQQIKVIIEKHSDGYVGYPLGMNGVVVGQGNTYADALANTESAIKFHIDTFGSDAFKIGTTVLDAFIAEAMISEVPG